MVQHRKYYLPMLIALLGGTWIGHSLSSSTHNTDSHHQIAVSSSEVDNKSLIAGLQQQVQDLKDKNHQLTQLLHARASESPALSPSTDQQKNITDTNQQLKNKLIELEIEQQLRKANDFGNWIMRSQNSNSQFNLNDELAHRFEQETRDPIWAEQEENHYQQLFSTRDEFREFALRDAQCRNTQCEVTVSTANPEQSHQLLQAINNTLQGSEVLVATDEQSGISKLYISNNKKGFEFN